MTRTKLRTMCLALSTTLLTTAAMGSEMVMECTGGYVAYYVLNTPGAAFMEQAVYQDGVFQFADGTEHDRLVAELSPEKNGDVVFGVCSWDRTAFEASKAIAYVKPLGGEMYSLQNSAFQTIGRVWLDQNNSAVGGAIGLQAFYDCGGTPTLHNAALFHTAADLQGIDSSAALVKDWYTLLRGRLAAAAEHRMTLSFGCTATSKSVYVNDVLSGKKPRVHYDVVDPTFNGGFGNGG